LQPHGETEMERTEGPDYKSMSRSERKAEIKRIKKEWDIYHFSLYDIFHLKIKQNLKIGRGNIL